ncbi:MAG: 6,7-dimethyl-8-ribityllumazine synthase [Candidatus Peregrinibacteria bacterium]|nr:6,7-dimethyl-8-ribityllumazine synthase [Candidatus Peregrinibacteria bacterium]MDZ4245091.1 6,7-dimethyl-8-ribityllumazine synthase [Candidatus Gracilibacteria bacterium]
MLEGSIKYSGGKIGIVVSRFNDDITGNLLKGAIHGLKKYGVPDVDSDGENMIEIVRVPGAFEIPLTAQKLLRGETGGEACDVVITLGVIIKGDTEHYEYVCKETADGIMRVQLDEGKPVIFEVLMVDNIEKAYARSVVPVDENGEGEEDKDGGSNWMKNKGYIAALNALEMINLYGKM